MPLRPVALDDLDWRQMTEAVRRRIPAASGGRWTFHAPVDPGITLLELFAWHLDQRLYWLDQVPDDLTRAALSLLGEAARPARPARSVLALDAADPGRFFAPVAGGSEFEMVDRRRGVVFTTEHDVVLLPVGGIGLKTDGEERGADLAEGRGLAVMTNAPASVAIVLRLRRKIPPGTAGRAAFLLELANAPGIAADWSAEAVEVAPPADLAWGYSVPGGEIRTFAEGAVDDGTGGLRRSGVVDFEIPPDWAPSGGPVDGLLPYVITVRTEDPTFSSPPRLRRIVANAARAGHWRRVEIDGRDQAAGWLPLPGIRLALDPGAPPPLEDSVALWMTESGGAERWRPADTLAFRGPADRAFVVDRDNRRLLFGDGLNGRVPIPDLAVAQSLETQSLETQSLETQSLETQSLVVAYRAGGGEAGNVGAGRRWEKLDEPSVSAVNPVGGVGGRESESLEAAGRRTAAALRRRHRAVTREDYEEIAETTPGVAIARAHVAVGFDPAHPCTPVPGVATVFLVAWAPRGENDGEMGGDNADDEVFIAAPLPDPGALAAVGQRLAGARLLGHEVFVRPARFRPVTLLVEAAGSPGAGALRQLREHFRRFLDPLEGGEESAGWPFGEPLRPSALLREAQEAMGEDGEALRVAVGLDGSPPREGCGDIAVGPHDLVFLDALELRLRPLETRLSRGGLR